MPWNDTSDLKARLDEALDTFDWTEAEKICAAFVELIKSEEELMSESAAHDLLKSLRRKRCFNLIQSVADALLQSGLRSPQVRRQYAQALIERGSLGAGQLFLQSILQDPQASMGEEFEARGLMGRIYKQIYIDRRDPTSARNRAALSRAVYEYLYVYRLNPEAHLWHGINVVALVERAERDDPKVEGLPDGTALAQEILVALARQEQRRGGQLHAWDVATRMEAYVALALRERGAAKKRAYLRHAADEALRYIALKDADAFAIRSTLRQLTEVWQLDEPARALLGNSLLPILRAGYFSKQGAAFDKNPQAVEEEAAVVKQAVDGLQRMFGPDRTVTVEWYEKGLRQCKPVARIETLDGKGFGTGWLVEASDFFSDRRGPLLLTNEHVISEDIMAGPPHAEYPDQTRANFKSARQVVGIGEIVGCSPRGQFDATFVTLTEQPKRRVKPLVLDKRPVQMSPPGKEPPRMYIIGYPYGGDLRLSLENNDLLDCNERFLHYRTQTDGGSSGSPVFGPKDWSVVGLHHRGKEEMPRLSGPGTYQANEGISILAIQRAAREMKNGQF